MQECINECKFVPIGGIFADWSGCQAGAPCCRNVGKLTFKRSVVAYNRFIVSLKTTTLLLLLLGFSACATVQKPLIGIVPGREVETLQSSIAISVQSGAQSTGGRGFLIFKAPDRFHLVVLSPFGLTVLEVFSEDDRLTCLIPSRQTAYSGLFSELPEASALKSLAMLNWVVAPPPGTGPSYGSSQTASAARFSLDDQGRVARKVSELGDQVEYQDYRNINGVAFPESIVIESRFGATVRIVFNEPQINLPVDDSTLAADMEGIRVLPLSEFRGF
jgi:hypothetical protein